MAPMAAPLLTLQNIVLSFGGDPLLSGVDLFVEEGSRICLVGRNGSGKSTLLKVAAGLVESDRGERFQKPGATVRYLPQEPNFAGFSTVLAYVDAGLTGGDHIHRSAMLLEQLAVDPSVDPAALSGGEARRVALARVLAPQPDILLLDEPTNHLDLPAIEWLETELHQSRSALVLISHDRRFLENLSRSTVWLERGSTRKLSKGFAFFEDWRDAELEREDVERHKLDRKIAMELDWVRYGVTARRKRNQRRLRELNEMRERRRTEMRAAGKVNLAIAAAPQSSKVVIEAIGLKKSFGAKPIVTDFDLKIASGDRVGFVGPNGAGKTTLLNMLTGLLVPDEGTIRIGETVNMVTLDQRREHLDPEETLGGIMTGGSGDTVVAGERRVHVATYLKDFLFSSEQLRTPVARLSGGERGRLMLARAFAKPSNLLVLDEPTNDLDLETLDVLQEKLTEYQGTVLLVSHDRDFLDRIVSSVVTLERPSVWREYPGGYSDMLRQRGSDLKIPEAKPQKKLRKVAPQNEDTAKSKKKLSFKEQYALQTLPEEIARLEENRDKLREKISDPQLYNRDPNSFNDLTAALIEIEGELREAEDKWLELELLREALSGN